MTTATAKQTMTALRGHLFDVIEELKKPEGMQVDKAETICLAAKRLLESAEVEIRFRSLIQRTSETASASAFLTDQRV